MKHNLIQRLQRYIAAADAYQQERDALAQLGAGELRCYRAFAGLSQEKFAESIGTTGNYLRKFETGGRLLTVEIARRIVEFDAGGKDTVSAPFSTVRDTQTITNASEKTP